MVRHACLAGLFAAILSTSVAAADAQLAGRTVHLDPNAGLCALEAAKNPDAMRVKMIRDTHRGIAEVAGYWADCQALSNWRAGKSMDLMPYVLIAAPLNENGDLVPVDAPNDVYMTTMKREILEQMNSSELLEDSRSLLVARTNEALAEMSQVSDFSAGTIQPIGMLSEDILAYAMLAPTAQSGQKRVIAFVGAPVQLNGISFMVHAYDVMQGPDTIDALHETVRRIVTDLAKA